MVSENRNTADRTDRDKLIRISVVIPVFNAGRYLEQVIDSLELQDYDRDRFEIIMVDNNSTDDSTAIIGRHPAIKLLQEPTQSSYAARNLGINSSVGEIIAFTDSDCMPQKDWLSKIEIAMRNPCTGIVLGRESASCRTTGVSLLNCYQHTRDTYIFNGEIGDLYYGYTNNMAVRRQLFDETLFSERMRGSDATFVSDVVERLSVESVQYDPEMLVTHLEITSIWVMFRKWFIYGRSQKLVEDETSWRPLTMLERIKVYGNTVRVHRFPPLHSAYLLTLLLFGVLCWVAGNVSARLFP